MRLLNRLKRFFPLTALRWQASVLNHSFDRDIAAAKAAGDYQKVNGLDWDRNLEVREYEDEISAIRTQRLLAEARRLYIYLPDLRWNAEITATVILITLRFPVCITLFEINSIREWSGE